MTSFPMMQLPVIFGKPVIRFCLFWEPLYCNVFFVTIFYLILCSKTFPIIYKIIIK
jgi:hypothetical protein